MSYENSRDSGTIENKSFLFLDNKVNYKRILSLSLWISVKWQGTLTKYGGQVPFNMLTVSRGGCIDLYGVSGVLEVGCQLGPGFRVGCGKHLACLGSLPGPQLCLAAQKHHRVLVYT